MIPLINHDSQWGRSEVVIIYPDYIVEKNIFETTNQMMVVHLDSPGESSHHPPTPAPQQRQAQELR